MSAGAMTALSVAQLLGYVGFVALGGLLMFRALITPERGRERRVVRIALVGLGLLVVSMVVRLAVMLTTVRESSATRFGMPVALVQLGVLVAVACYLPDLLGTALTAWRRGLAVAAAVALAIVVVLPMILGTSVRSAAGAVITVAHVLAIGTWVGGMVAVALLVLPSGAGPRVLAVLQVILRRSRGKVVLLIVVLVVSGLLALLVQPGRVSGLSTEFWVLLLAKVVLFAALIAAAARVRQQIERAVFRSEHIAESGDSLVALRRVVRVEMVVAAAAIAATAVLTVLTPLS